MLLALWRMFQSGVRPDFITLFFMFAAYALVILVALPVHELAHAYTAYRMGDNTARWNGRLTMNPFAHLDVIGTAMIFIFGFGYAKPVPVNPNNFRDRKKGMLLTSFAGPLSNLIMAFLSLTILRIFYTIVPSGVLSAVFLILLDTFASINIMLAVFNLLPIPPLDGFRILSNFLPAKWSYFVDRYQWYITMGLFMLIATGVLSGVLGFLVGGVERIFYMILRF